jgi:AcrR family transcriptional regulator
MADDRHDESRPDAGSAAASLWERLERPREAGRGSLNAAAIGAAAVALADAEGIEAVSMRHVASRLGVAPMALYRYVAGKTEVFELMVDAVYAEAELPAHGGGWREVLRAHAEQTRSLALRHPWLSHVAARTLAVSLTPNRAAATERGLAALARLGVDPDTAMGVLDTVTHYARGAVAAEVAQADAMAREGWGSRDDLRGGLSLHMNWLMDTGRYPAYRAWTRGAARKDDFDWRFAFGLDCVLDGVAARLGV